MAQHIFRCDNVFDVLANEALARSALSALSQVSHRGLRQAKGFLGTLVPKGSLTKNAHVQASRSRESKAILYSVIPVAYTTVTLDFCKIYEMEFALVSTGKSAPYTNRSTPVY